jgi:hypothetical protein
MENKPFKVLIANATGGMYTSTGNQPFNATTNLPVLAAGQLGVFNAENNKSCNTALSDGTSTAKKIYFAVGVDKDGDGTVEDIIKSPVIKVSDIKTKSQDNYATAVAEVQQFSWTVTKCDTEYGIKIVFDGVNVSSLFGHHTLTKTFATKTGCCTDCNADCAEDSYSCTALANELVALINADPDGFVVASTSSTNDFAKQTITVANATYTTGAVSIDLRPFSATATANVIRLSGPYPTGSASELQADILAELVSAGFGGSVNVVEVGSNYEITVLNTNAARFGIGANATTAATADSAATSALASPAAVDNCPEVVLTVQNQKLADFWRVPVNLVMPNGFTMSVTGFSGFSCNFDVETTTNMSYEKGNKFTIKGLEEEATGFGENYDTYRYTLFTQPDPYAKLYTDVSATGYDLFALEFVDVHNTTSSGKDVYSAPIGLFIAIKYDTTLTTRNNLVTVFGNL